MTFDSSPIQATADAAPLRRTVLGLEGFVLSAQCRDP